MTRRFAVGHGLTFAVRQVARFVVGQAATFSVGYGAKLAPWPLTVGRWGQSKQVRTSTAPPSSLGWRTPPARGAGSRRRPIDNASTLWLTAPGVSATARRISRTLTNCVTLRTTNCSAKLLNCQTMFYTNCCHHYPPHHNNTTSATARTHYSYLNTTHTCLIAAS